MEKDHFKQLKQSGYLDKFEKFTWICFNKKINNRNGNLICLNKQLNKMLQRQPIVLTQVKAVNTLGNILTRQTVCSLYEAEEITKK